MTKKKSTIKTNSFNFTVKDPEHKNHGAIMRELTEYLNKTKYGYWDGYGGSIGGKELDQFGFVKADKYSTVVSYFKNLIKKNKATSNYKLWKKHKEIYFNKAKDFGGSLILN